MAYVIRFKSMFSDPPKGCVYAATYNGEDGAEQLGYSRTVDLANVYDTRDEAELVLANGYSPHLRQLGEVVAYDPWTMNGAPSCACDSGPLIDVEHDAGCRRCGLPVNFAPTEPIR